jgi:hypothetical protein
LGLIEPVPSLAGIASPKPLAAAAAVAFQANMPRSSRHVELLSVQQRVRYRKVTASVMASSSGARGNGGNSRPGWSP